MGVVKWVASLVIKLDENGKTKPGYDRMNHVNAIFITLYAVLTGILMWNLLSSGYNVVFDGTQSESAINAREKLGHIILNYTLYMMSLASIHLWVYLARRFYVGMYGENGFFRSREFQESYEKIWYQSVSWFEPFPVHTHTVFESFIKLLYLAGWMLLCLTVMVCSNNMNLFHFYDTVTVNGEIKGIHFKNLVVFIGVCLYLLSMVLNYISYFMCIAFTWFIRKISNHASEIEFNHVKPSNTPGFQQLLHASSRVAIAFFSDSMLYLILTIVEIETGKRCHIIGVKDTLGIVVIMMSVLIPCVLSFFVIYLLPKAFLSRLLRKWKMLAVEKILNNCKLKKINEKKNAMLTMIYEDHLPFIKAEAATAAAAVAVDIVSIVLSLRL